MWLRPGVAMPLVWASSCSSDLTPSLGTSIGRRYGPKKKIIMMVAINIPSLIVPCEFIEHLSCSRHCSSQCGHCSEKKTQICARAEHMV